MDGTVANAFSSILDEMLQAYQTQMGFTEEVLKVFIYLFVVFIFSLLSLSLFLPPFLSFFFSLIFPLHIIFLMLFSYFI